MVMATILITQDPVIDSILEPYRVTLGPSLYAGYRDHAYRMVNFARALTPPEPDRDHRLAVMAAFHDLLFASTAISIISTRPPTWRMPGWKRTVARNGGMRSAS